MDHCLVTTCLHELFPDSSSDAGKLVMTYTAQVNETLGFDYLLALQLCSNIQLVLPMLLAGLLLFFLVQGTIRSRKH